MELFETISKRHSYRGEFASQPVSRDDLTAIVQSAIQAPSGCNAQTTTFVIVDEPALVKSISEIVEKPALAAAGAIIVTVMEKRAVYNVMSFGVEDYACAVQNMLLAITALGYATCWIDGALRTESRAQRIAALLSIPEPLQVRVILPVGRPAKQSEQPHKKPFNQRASFNTYAL